MFRRMQHLKLVRSFSLKSAKSTSAIKFQRVRSNEINQLRRNIVMSKTSLNFDQMHHPPDHPEFAASTPILNERQGLRVDLYSENGDPVLNSIYECTSMQQVFDIFTSLSENSTLNEKHSCQSLVTLWDIQKFMFRLGHLFDPSAPYLNREHYIGILREHPVLQSIIEHVVGDREILGDEPLAAALHVLRRLNFAPRHSNCQKIIEELLKRKQSLEPSALSRLCVSMRNEPLYGFLVIAELSPILFNHVQTMRTNKEIRSVSIALRSSFRCLNDSIIREYRERLSDIWLDKSISIQLESITICKIIMLLYDCLIINENNGNNLNSSNETSTLANTGTGAGDEGKVSEGKTVLSASSLLRNYANLLVPKVHEMDEMDIVTMYKFIQHQPEPVQLAEAMSTRVLQLVETNPSLDLLTCVQPKNHEQKVKLGSYISHFIDNCTYFDKVSHIVLRILFKINFDRILFDKYWGKVHQLILTGREEDGNDIEKDKAATTGEEFSSDFKEGSEDDDSFEDNSDEIESLGLASGKYRIISYSHDYLKFVLRHNRAYSNRELERVMEEDVLKLFKGIENYEIILNPSGYAKCVSFLVYMKYPGIEYRWSENYLKNFRIKDLLNVQKALNLNPRRRDSYSITNEINKQAAKFLTYGTLHPYDYVGIAKLGVEFQRHFNFSPNFIESMEQLARLPWDDSRLARELITLVLSTNYYDPLIFERVSKFICEFPHDTPVVCAEKFVHACFVCASEEFEGIAVSAEIIKSKKDKMYPLMLLQSMISFCYYGCLDLELVGHVFDVGFLDLVDEQIKTYHAYTSQPMKIRQTFMELNRAVCIDKPEANVPWFHQKFCEQVASVSDFRDTYLHHEVGQVLNELSDGQMYVAKNVYSPYFYLIDFLLQFDKGGNPLKPNGNGEPRKDAASKVAVLLHNPLDFTTNIRRLKGGHKMKARHLEMLGYRVIDIDPIVWNSMGMSERLAKNDYLQASIFSKT